jgi:hypothetical protein
MPRYEVYSTRYDDTHIVDGPLPARGLEFSLPLNDHGEATFTANVEPGRSFWRPSVALPMSGILITRDDVPVWSGWVTDEDPAGPRSTTFRAREWGHFFEEKVPAAAHTWVSENDHQIFRDLISAAQSVSGQNIQITMDATTMGAFYSDRTINSWDDTTVGREFRALSDALGGPEWYFGTAGTVDNPVRRLILGDRLGQTTPQTTLEFVEDTVDYAPPDSPPHVALLGDLFPGPPMMVPTRRAGGNLIAQSRSRSVSNAVTVVSGIGAGEGVSRKETLSEATRLLNFGWPRLTTVTPHTDVDTYVELQAFSDADLAKFGGIQTSYKLVALDGDPDWTMTPRGSVVQVILGTDLYGADRPVGGPDGFNARLRNTVVRVADNGPTQVEWQVDDVQEVQ